MKNLVFTKQFRARPFTVDTSELVEGFEKGEVVFPKDLLKGYALGELKKPQYEREVTDTDVSLDKIKVEAKKGDAGWYIFTVTSEEPLDGGDNKHFLCWKYKGSRSKEELLSYRRDILDIVIDILFDVKYKLVCPGVADQEVVFKHFYDIPKPIAIKRKYKMEATVKLKIIPTDSSCPITIDLQKDSLSEDQIGRIGCQGNWFESLNTDYDLYLNGFSRDTVEMESRYESGYLKLSIFTDQPFLSKIIQHNRYSGRENTVTLRKALIDFLESEVEKAKARPIGSFRIYPWGFVIKVENIDVIGYGKN